jgi:DNA-binding NtrC family response regulator
LLAVRRSLAHPPHAGEPDREASAALRRGTLLLVEDHAPSRLALEVLFEDEGYRVLAAADGGTALRLCREHDGGIDVLLTDVGLPDVGVDVFVRELRELKPPLGIICMSGRCADDPEVHHATSMRGVTFVEKPIDFTVLSHLVEQMVAAMPAEREPMRAARP